MTGNAIRRYLTRDPRRIDRYQETDDLTTAFRRAWANGCVIDSCGDRPAAVFVLPSLTPQEIPTEYVSGACRGDHLATMAARADTIAHHRRELAVGIPE